MGFVPVLRRECRHCERRRTASRLSVRQSGVPAVLAVILLRASWTSSAFRSSRLEPLKTMRHLQSQQTNQSHAHHPHHPHHLHHKSTGDLRQVRNDNPEIYPEDNEKDTRKDDQHDKQHTSNTDKLDNLDNVHSALPTPLVVAMWSAFAALSALVTVAVGIVLLALAALLCLQRKQARQGTHACPRLPPVRQQIASSPDNLDNPGNLDNPDISDLPNNANNPNYPNDLREPSKSSHRSSKATESRFDHHVTNQHDDSFARNDSSSSDDSRSATRRKPNITMRLPSAASAITALPSTSTLVPTSNNTRVCNPFDLYLVFLLLPNLLFGFFGMITFLVFIFSVPSDQTLYNGVPISWCRFQSFYTIFAVTTCAWMLAVVAQNLYDVLVGVSAKLRRRQQRLSRAGPSSTDLLRVTAHDDTLQSLQSNFSNTPMQISDDNPSHPSNNSNNITNHNNQTNDTTTTINLHHDKDEQNTSSSSSHKKLIHIATRTGLTLSPYPQNEKQTITRLHRDYSITLDLINNSSTIADLTACRGSEGHAFFPRTVLVFQQVASVYAWALLWALIPLLPSLQWIPVSVVDHDNSDYAGFDSHNQYNNPKYTAVVCLPSLSSANHNNYYNNNNQYQNIFNNTENNITSSSPSSSPLQAQPEQQDPLLTTVTNNRYIFFYAFYLPAIALIPILYLLWIAYLTHSKRLMNNLDRDTRMLALFYSRIAFTCAFSWLPSFVLICIARKLNDQTHETAERWILWIGYFLTYIVPFAFTAFTLRHKPEIRTAIYTFIFKRQQPKHTKRRPLLHFLPTSAKDSGTGAEGNAVLETNQNHRNHHHFFSSSSLEKEQSPHMMAHMMMIATNDSNESSSSWNDSDTLSLYACHKPLQQQAPALKLDNFSSHIGHAFEHIQSIASTCDGDSDSNVVDEDVSIELCGDDSEQHLQFSHKAVLDDFVFDEELEVSSIHNSSTSTGQSHTSGTWFINEQKEHQTTVVSDNCANKNDVLHSIAQRHHHLLLHQSTRAKSDRNGMKLERTNMMQRSFGLGGAESTIRSCDGNFNIDRIGAYGRPDTVTRHRTRSNSSIASICTLKLPENGAHSAVTAHHNDLESETTDHSRRSRSNSTSSHKSRRIDLLNRTTTLLDDIHVSPRSAASRKSWKSSSSFNNNKNSTEKEDRHII